MKSIMLEVNIFCYTCWDYYLYISLKGGGHCYINGAGVVWVGWSRDNVLTLWAGGIRNF